MSESEDFHKSVLVKAFTDIKQGSGLISVNSQININRDILLFYSPLFRSILKDLSCGNNIPDVKIIIPEADADLNSIIKIQNLICYGECPGSYEETMQILFYCQLLGLPIKRILYGKQQLDTPSNGLEEIEVENIPNETDRIRQLVKEGKGILLHSQSNRENLLERGSNENSGESNENKKSTTEEVSETEKEPAVRIKTEIPEETLEEAAADENTANDDASANKEDEAPLAQPMEQDNTQVPPQQNDTKPPASETNEKSKEECHKCNKTFSNINILKNHYCGHFLSILKKKFASSYDEEKLTCKECQRSDFINLQKLLVHLGIFHNKINLILKAKGLPQLPPYLPPQSKPTKKVKQEVPMKPPQPPKSDPPQALVPGPPLLTPQKPTPTIDDAGKVPTSEKKSLDSECNFNLECQVCKQKLGSLHLLEQHLCRHFMKELQEHCANLIDDLKCTLCHSTFKQKHSLVLHMGCKHGKINEILKMKNFQVLPAPVMSNPTSAMQKQLIKVKKERMDTTEPMKEHTREIPTKPIEKNVVSATPNVASLLQESSALTTPTSSSLDDILKKYNIPSRYTNTTQS